MESNPYGHPPDCTCWRCEEWRDVQLGQEILQQMKKKKQLAQCGSCNKPIPTDANFCPHCGSKT